MTLIYIQKVERHCEAGPHGETIIDYSIYDALQCGFGKIVFVIREDFASEFKEMFNEKSAGKIKTEYVYQEMDSRLHGFSVATERTKPWGTAHAVLCAKDVIHEPFAVITADIFYGRDAFEKAAAFLTHAVSEKNIVSSGISFQKHYQKMELLAVVFVRLI